MSAALEKNFREVSWGVGGVTNAKGTAVFLPCCAGGKPGGVQESSNLVCPPQVIPECSPRRVAFGPLFNKCQAGHVLQRFALVSRAGSQCKAASSMLMSGGDVTVSLGDKVVEGCWVLVWMVVYGKEC